MILRNAWTFWGHYHLDCYGGPDERRSVMSACFDEWSIAVEEGTLNAPTPEDDPMQPI